MSKIIHIVFLISLALQIGTAQITVGKKTIPSPGDNLKMIVSEVIDLDLETSGPDKLWNFAQLRGGVLENSRFDITKYENSGEVVYKSSTNNDLLYFKKGEVGIYQTASYGYDPILSIPNSKIKFNTPKLVRPYSFNYENFFISSYDYDQIIPSDKIPENIKSFLPSDKDSIKISVKVNMTMEVDAWGKLILQQGNNYDVLRVKEINKYNAKLYTKSENQWVEVDISQVRELKRLMIDITTTSYRFYNNFSKEVITEVYINKKNQIISLKYKDLDSELLIPNEQNGEQDIYIYPNPSFGAINAVFLNVDPGMYTLKVSNILGKKIWSSDYKLNKNGIFKENLSYLSKGPYLYSITGPNGNRLVTRKITILKP